MIECGDMGNVRDLGCGCENTDWKENRKIGIVTLYRDELLHDCRKLGWLVHDVSEGDSELSRQNAADVGERSYVDRATRVMDLAFSKCVSLCHPWTKRVARCGTEKDDIYEERPFYRMLMRLPEEISETTLDYLEKLVHEYIVCRVMWDWLSIVQPDQSEGWLARSADAVSELQSILSSRTGRVRRKTRPF